MNIFRRLLLILPFCLGGPIEALGQNLERVMMAVPGIGLSQNFPRSWRKKKDLENRNGSKFLS